MPVDDNLCGFFLHTGYKCFLIKAYQGSDLSQVYPIALGYAPLLIFSALALFLNIPFSYTDIFAVSAISMGIFVMVLKGAGTDKIHIKA